MIRLLSYIIASILLTSCASYQYVSLSSDLSKNDTSETYTYSDENTIITYDFWGKNFPTHISIENISDEDIFLDLQKSLFLKDDIILADAVPKTKSKIKGNISYYGTYNDYGAIDAVAESSNPGKLIYIPAGKQARLTYSIFSFPFSKQIRKKSQIITYSVNGKNQSQLTYVIPESEAPHYGIRLYFIAGSPDNEGYPVECSFTPNMVFTNQKSPQAFILKGSEVFYTLHRSKGGTIALYIGGLSVFILTLGLLSTN